MDSHLEPPTADQRIIWDIYFSSHILPLVAFSDEVGIFELLERGPLATSDVAVRLNIDNEWAEILLGALVSLQLVRLQDGRFHNTDAARSYLLPGETFYAGFSLRRFAGRNVYERLKRAISSASSMPAAAETATSVYVVRDWQEGELARERVEEGVRTMHGLSFPAAVALARNADFADARRLLDVAGGSGGFSIALAQRYPSLRCTVAELPVVCPITQAYISRYGVADRVDTLPLNMFFEPWPSGYDAIFLSCALHDWDLNHRTALMRQAFDTLPSTGRIHIHEMLLADTADGPLASALYSLAMRIGTLGKQFTTPELRAALEGVGFTDVTVRNTTQYFSLLSARKP
jgi:acetylserotonin N-methyltransferase